MQLKLKVLLLTMLGKAAKQFKIVLCGCTHVSDNVSDFDSAISLSTSWIFGDIQSNKIISLNFLAMGSIF